MQEDSRKAVLLALTAKNFIPNIEALNSNKDFDCRKSVYRGVLPGALKWNSMCIDKLF